MKRVLINMKGYLEEVGHLTKLNPQDAWLPITESRNGNAHYAAFHNLNAGVGFQALVLPVAFAFLGWYATFLLPNSFHILLSGFYSRFAVQLHEAVPGKRYNRYVELAQAAFGERLGVWLALFPTVYLSAGTATALILIGGETMKLFFQIVCGPLCTSNPLTTVECMNALGIVAFAFRGHNLVLEIQATMPSTFKHPAHIPMWKGAKVAYFFIAMCLFLLPLEASGLMEISHDIPRGLLALTFLLVVFNCLSSFQIYSMPVFDSFEAGYTSRTNRPCSIWVRSGFRVFYGFISFFIGVALPFLSSLAGLLGGLTLPVTFAYPCFMWVLIKRPTKYSFNWYFNWILGWLGIAFSLAFSIGGVWSMVNSGLKLKFFKPPN
ncbi:hypothetical protein GH714_014104 [Hevea brasiliensis]|uniref:Amino acid transporter transmembrane domain-containing protein n=1 Tax=Hevea brasiliensis TaxID=3981 RepID=A0A6A6NH52_HEVBR|nr:hypothetical protein GH714_014104 [Hevea brasiliensis]